MTVRFAFREKPSGAGPIVKATSLKLKPGWYQIDISVANRGPYRLFMEELRRVRPRSVRLMAPIKRVRTRDGDFQVWSDPATDRSATAISLDGVVAANEEQEAHIAAWLFTPKGEEPSELTLELLFRDGDKTQRRLRFSVTGETRAGCG